MVYSIEYEDRKTLKSYKERKWSVLRSGIQAGSRLDRALNIDIRAELEVDAVPGVDYSDILNIPSNRILKEILLYTA